MDNPEHVSAFVATLALFVAAMVVTFVTDPPAGTDDHVPNPLLYIPYLFSIYLSFFIGVGLSAHLILCTPANLNQTIMWIHGKLILFGLGLFSVSFVLRTCMTSPLHLLWIVWLLLLFIIVSIIIVIVIVRKYRPQEMDRTRIFRLLESPDALKAKVAEAMEVLRNVSQQQASSPTVPDVTK
ncbi:hypothetical protein HHK36_018015 [Tetracentron sinense]|uniref:Uncharacterized protein n=1 Tax=Tetracentron sinense TaxID=13715 RepID=A0A834Z1I6_TETSI|nr:hypothetical protein HHK36_018015 [Tetracentron sinense]